MVHFVTRVPRRSCLADRCPNHNRQMVSVADRAVCERLLGGTRPADAQRDRGRLPASCASPAGGLAVG